VRSSSFSGVAADRRDLQAGGEVIWVAHTGDASMTYEQIKGTPLDFIPGLEPKGAEQHIIKAQGSR
jgi:hypothetical protein